MILYFECNRSLFGRNAIADHLSQYGFEGIDFTGGQAAFEDGDFETFGKQIIEYARNENIGMHHILRIDDPGLGLMFRPQWVKDGVDSGRFQRCEIPKDVYAGGEGSNEEYFGRFEGAIEELKTLKAEDPSYAETCDELIARFQYKPEQDSDERDIISSGVAFSNQTLLLVSTIGFASLGLVLFLILRRLSTNVDDKNDHGHQENRDAYDEMLDHSNVATLNRAQRRARAKFRMKKARRVVAPVLPAL